MMIKISLAISAALLLTACGGGSSSDSGSSSDNNGGSARAAIQGNWISDCLARSDGNGSGILTQRFDTNSSGVDIFIQGIENFDTSNCTGSSSDLFLVGRVAYDGEFATSVCITEKVDMDITAVVDNNGTLDGESAQNFLDDSGIDNPLFDIACTIDNQLFLGLTTSSLDGSSNSNRPREIDTGIPFDFSDIGLRPTQADQNTDDIASRALAVLKSLK